MFFWILKKKRPVMASGAPTLAYQYRLNIIPMSKLTLAQHWKPTVGQS